MSRSKNHNARQVSHVRASTGQVAPVRIPRTGRSPKPPSPRFETLDELMNYAAKRARDVFDRLGSLSPMYLCERKNGDLQFVLPTEYGDDKDLLAEGMRALFKKERVKRYVSISEVWTSHLPPKEGSSLASNPDRGEAVLLYAEDKFEARAAEMSILRTKRGKPKLSALRKFPDTFGIGGRLSGLLSEKNEKRCPSGVLAQMVPPPSRSAIERPQGTGAVQRNCAAPS